MAAAQVGKARMADVSDSQVVVSGRSVELTTLSRYFLSADGAIAQGSGNDSARRWMMPDVDDDDESSGGGFDQLIESGIDETTQA